MTTTTRVDLESLTAAIEADDPAAIAEAYAPDAVIHIVNRDHGPGTPLVLRGRDALRTLLDDVAGRHLAHRVERAVAGEQTGALQVRCTYPDGATVACVSTSDWADGHIVRETRVEVWDG